ncbi:uncharacterized protein LOC131437179 isoform X2 [Malaya genurostris]|nr:uncharacterized protein LOC131437179 isoform X2 [Malaya genurostris]XP_058462337.1 uncharacterized protein LOC131437179 isoform X2 [Malaya genurostris]XP_058462338.1 uncharacterized protein LOC131437179 isoform X2 [Malaya genurostris]
MSAADLNEEIYMRRGRAYVSAVPGNPGVRPVYLNDAAMFYDSVENIPTNVRFRNRPSYNESLSSLNESDYECSYETGLYRDDPAPIGKEQVVTSLSRFGAILNMLSKIPFPRLSVTGMGLCSLVAIFICPRTLGANILYPGFRLLFGTLYPAYASYKAVRTKNVKEYVKWMMYWIVFAFFTCVETFTDILLSWFPFYYEIKVIIVLWLLSPATRGSSTLYRKFVHPMLTRREQEIDDYINQAKEKGYTAVLQLGSKGVNYATNVIMQTAIKGGGGLVQTLRKSYSLSDLSETDAPRTQEEMDELTRPQRVLRSKSARSASGGRHVEMYFPEVEIAGTPHHNPPPYNYIRSSDDISSGYSSAEPGLSRTASMSNTVRPRVKSKTREVDEDVFYDGSDTDRYYSSGSQFHPFATLYEIPPSPLPAITQANGSTPNSMIPPVYTSQTNSVPSSPLAMPAEVEQKYELFLKWMESQTQNDNPHVGTFSATNDRSFIDSDVDDSNDPKVVTNIIPPSDHNLSAEKEDIRIEAPVAVPILDGYREQSEKDLNEDAFRDTMSSSSVSEDEFLEIDDSFSESMINDANEMPSNVEGQVNNEIQPIEKPSLFLGVPIPAVVDALEKNVEVNIISEILEGAIFSEVVGTDSIPFPVEKLHVSEENISSNDVENRIKTDKPAEILFSESLQATKPISDHLNVSTSNLTSSTSSLAVSEASSQAGDLISSKKTTSHGKRKAPPVPIAFKAETLILSVDAPTAPKLAVKVTKPIPIVSHHTKTIPPEGSNEKEKDKRHKTNKLMSSFSGMFKHDATVTTASGPSAPSRARDSSLPKETEI